MQTWCAIGDSFTYLNDHLDETGNIVARGYLSRALDKLPPLCLRNLGINGSTTRDWLTAPLAPADVYTILLGTNDWHQGIPLGDRAAFRDGAPGTILGNLGNLLGRLRALSPQARVLVCNPVERADFVYLFDPYNNAPGSYAPEHGQTLAGIARGICDACRAEGVPALDLHGRSGITPENAVRFKRVRTADGVRDLPYPDYAGLPFDPEKDPYPYPPEARALTYDGLHPTDEGNEILAALLAEALRPLL